MKRWALIKNNLVDMVVEQNTQPQIQGVWVECSDKVGPGWSYDGNKFTAPPEPDVTE